MTNNLSDKMKDRLKKWQSRDISIPPQKLVSQTVKPHLPPYIARRGDYGDDISDFTEKDRKAWSGEFFNK